MPARSAEWNTDFGPSAATWICWLQDGAPYAPTATRELKGGAAMPETFLGDGLTFEELLPLCFIPGPLPQGLGLARLNADNYQLLGAESSLDEVRVSEALKEESAEVLPE